MPENDYKPNSHKYNEAHNASVKEEEPARKKPTVREHTTVGQRFKDTFFAESFKSVVDYFVWDVVIPAAKDIVLRFVETTLFGRNDYGLSYRRSDGYNTSRNNYRRASTRIDEPVRAHSKRKFNIDIFEFDSRRDAEDVLRQMNDHARRYDGICSVAAFYDFVDCERPNDWTHERWGWSWNALDRARIVPRSNGYYTISLPEPDTYID